MQFSVENVSSLGRKLTLKVPTEQLDTKVNKRITEMSRTIRLKGFRPGRVPPQIVRQRYGDQIRGEELSTLINDGLQEALTENDLTPANQPVIDEIGEPENGEIACVARFEAMPELPEVDASALEIERVKSEVTDADIDNMVDSLRKQHGSLSPVDKAAEKGNFVTFDYAIETKDHRHPEEGMTQSGTVLGEGQMFDAMETLLLGKSADEEVEDEITFPEDFGNEDFAGKKATVKAKIVKVQDVVLPELNDEFFKRFGIESGKEEEFRQEVRANLERELRAVLGAKLKGEVAEKLAQLHADVELPESMVDGEIKAMIQSQNGNSDSEKEPSKEQMDEVRPEAKKRVVAALLMGEIARKQEIVIDRDRMAEVMMAIASNYQDPQKVIEMYNNNEQMMRGLQSRVMEEQVAEWVAEKANTTDKTVSFDELMR